MLDVDLSMDVCYIFMPKQVWEILYTVNSNPGMKYYRKHF